MKLATNLLTLLSAACLAERHGKMLARMQALRDNWKPWKAWMLHIGTVAGLLAAALSIIDGLFGCGTACGSG